MTTDVTTFAIADYMTEASYTTDYQTQRIQVLNKKIEVLEKRLKLTKEFADCLWQELQESK